MRKAKVDTFARWLWLPLLAIIFLLLAALTNLRRETESLRTTAETLGKQASEIRVEVATVPTTAPAASMTSPPAKPPAKPAGLTGFSDRNAIGEAEYGAIIARRHRRYAMANYRQAIDSLHLSRADEDRLKQLIAAKWIAREDAGDVLDRMGDASPALRKQAAEAAQAEAQQQITTLLGDDGYAKFQATFEESATNKMNWGLVTALWDAGLPLTTEQQNAYARAQQQVRSQFPRQGNEPPADPDTGLSQSDLALLRAVSSFLSSEQIAFIREDRIAEARSVNAARAMEQRKASSAGPGR